MDLRIRKTYKALLESFTELMEEKKYDDIAIAELCERAMIRRTTFYKHFANKDEFFVFYIGSLHDEFYERIKGSPESETLTQCSSRMLNEMVGFLIEHEKLVDNVFDSPSAPMLLNELELLVSRQVAMNIREMGPRSPEEIESIAALYGGGMLAMVRRWWIGGRDQLMMDTISRTLDKTVAALL